MFDVFFSRCAVVDRVFLVAAEKTRKGDEIREKESTRAWTRCGSAKRALV
jgi:hypothetical protein